MACELMYFKEQFLRALMGASGFNAHSIYEVCAPLHFDDDTVTLFANGAVAECVFGFLAPATPNGNPRKMVNTCTYIRSSATDETLFSQSIYHFPCDCLVCGICRWVVCRWAPVDEGCCGSFAKAMFVHCSRIA